MKDSINLHKKVQELCDCYSTTDPLKEMSELNKEEEGVDGALKWLALTALHGVNNNAKKITIVQSDDGVVSVTAEYRGTRLPSPAANVAANVFEVVREILHMDEAKGKSRLSLGLRDSSIELDVSVKEKPGYKKVSVKFEE
ncbi:hypothetical protein [Desulfospira joergensenii]|uniref:hypothetical protein n=1 Tax=Desulfospira joergensenii TaxID=53329 RepID=UPI0003B65C3E|nr:hypothetical protein [Desulfospira joergensenii]